MNLINAPQFAVLINWFVVMEKFSLQLQARKLVIVGVWLIFQMHWDNLQLAACLAKQVVELFN